MAYDYKKERSSIFTEDGVKTLVTIRDTASKLSKISGCFTAEKAWGGITGGTWEFMACLDYLCETRFLVEIKQAEVPVGQHRIFMVIQN